MTDTREAGPPLSTRVRRLAAAAVALAAAFGVYESVYGSPAIAAVAVAAVAYLAYTGRS